MANLIDKVESHFDSVMANGLQGPISVPEWDTELYWLASTTLAEESIVLELTQNGKTTEALVMSLILRARDKDGKQVFHKGDKIKLMRVADPKVLLRVITEMNDAQSDIDNAVKN